MTKGFDRTNLNKVKRLTKRGHYDKATIYHIIDDSLICHVDNIHEDQPMVIYSMLNKGIVMPS